MILTDPSLQSPPPAAPLTAPAGHTLDPTKDWEKLQQEIERMKRIQNELQQDVERTKRIQRELLQDVERTQRIQRELLKDVESTKRILRELGHAIWAAAY